MSTSQFSISASETVITTSSFVPESTTTFETISLGQSIAIQTCVTTVTINSHGDCITITQTTTGTYPLFPTESGTSEMSIISPTLTSADVQPGNVVGNSLASENTATNIHSSNEDEQAKTVAGVSIISNEGLTYAPYNPLPTGSKSSILDINGNQAPATESLQFASPDTYPSIDTDYSLVTSSYSASVTATLNQGSNNFKTVSSVSIPSLGVPTFSTTFELSSFTYVSVYSGNAAFSKKRSSLLWTFLFAIAYI